MSNFISIPVDSSDNLIVSSQKIVTCVRTSSTETIIVLDGGTASHTSTDQLTLTHNTDTATDSVAKSIMDAVVSSFSDISKASVVRVAVPTQTITSVDFS